MLAGGSNRRFAFAVFVVLVCAFRRWQKRDVSKNVFGHEAGRRGSCGALMFKQDLKNGALSFSNSIL